MSEEMKAMKQLERTAKKAGSVLRGSGRSSTEMLRMRDWFISKINDECAVNYGKRVAVPVGRTPPADSSLGKD